MADLSLLEFRRWKKSDGINENSTRIVFTDSVLEHESQKLHGLMLEFGGHFHSFYPKYSLKNYCRNFGVKFLSRTKQGVGADPIIIKPNFSCAMQNTRLTSIVTDASLLVTGRFHGVMMSVATKTPFLAMGSNTPKIEATLHDIFNFSDRVLSEQEMQKLLGRQQVDPKFLAFSKSETEKIDQYIKTAEGKVPLMFRSISDDIEIGK